MCALYSSEGRGQSFLSSDGGHYKLFEDQNSQSPSTLQEGIFDSRDKGSASNDASPAQNNQENNSQNPSGDYRNGSVNDLSYSRNRTLTQQIELLDSSLGVGSGIGGLSHFDGTHTRRYSEDSSRFISDNQDYLTTQYGFFDDNNNSKKSFDFGTADNYPRARSVSGGMSPNICRQNTLDDFDSYVRPSFDNSSHDSRMMNDLFRWVWGVIYKNDGFIPIKILANLLYIASSQWYAVIENEFFGLQNFIQQFPLEFYITKENGAYCVSLMPEQDVSHVRNRSRPLSSGPAFNGNSMELKNNFRSASRNSTKKDMRSFNSATTLNVDEIVSSIISHTCALLRTIPNATMKAVELANNVRDTFGTSTLSIIRERYLGLLNMLENFPDLFEVTRIPKNDFVSLVQSSTSAYPSSFNASSFNTPTPGLYGDFPDVMASTPTGTRSASSSRIVTPSPSTPISQPAWHKMKENHDDSKAANRIVSTKQVSKIHNTIRCLHVGNVGIRASDEDLRDEFGYFGEIEDIKIVHQGERRYAFVYFVNADDAEAARANLIKLPKWKGNISFAKKEKDASERKAKSALPSRHLWLGNINTRTVSASDLRYLFEPFGSIENINILYEKNCVFIDYCDESSAIAAQSGMKGMTLGGNIIELGFGKYEERIQECSAIVMSLNDKDIILDIFDSIMARLRFREHISLGDIYNRIVYSADFKKYKEANSPKSPQFASKSQLSVAASSFVPGCSEKNADDCVGEVTTEDEKDSSGESKLMGNMEILKSILMSSTNYVIQQDLNSLQIFFSNNIPPTKVPLTEDILMDLLKDLMLSRMQLLMWPKFDARDSFLIYTVKSVINDNNGIADFSVVANAIVDHVFFTRKSFNACALEKFIKTYNDIFLFNDGVISIIED